MEKPNFEVGAVHWRSPVVFTHRMKNSMLLGKHSRHCCQTDFWLLQALRLPHHSYRTCHSTHQLDVGHPWLKCPVLIISYIWFVLLPEARYETHVRRTYVLQANIFQKMMETTLSLAATHSYIVDPILPKESNSSTTYEFTFLEHCIYLAEYPFVQFQISWLTKTSIVTFQALVQMWRESTVEAHGTWWHTLTLTLTIHSIAFKE